MLKYIKNSHNSVSTNMQTVNPTKNRVEGMNRYLFKEAIQMVKRHRKKGSTSMIIREMKIRTTMTYLLTPVRTIIKTTRNKTRKFPR